MKYIFCNQRTGSFNSYHADCYNKVRETLTKIEIIINDYNQNKLDEQKAKFQLLEYASSDGLYKNYLEHEIVDMTAIRTNEIIIYVEPGTSVSESKNRCKMVETGYRYERKPVWNEKNCVIGNNVKIVVTDKAIYMILLEKALRYPYNKIVNLDYDEKWRYTYFDVKTASPYPHRFFIRTINKKERNKAANICLFLKCLMGYKEK